MREMLLGALKSYYIGNINRHIANVEIYLRTSVGIGEHSDIQGSIDKELESIDKFDAKLSVLNAFKGKQYIKNVKGAKIIATENPYNSNTMQHREWQRGYNFAYFKNVEKLKREESRRRSQRVYEEKEQHVL
jgi:hypothetical protein